MVKSSVTGRPVCVVFGPQSSAIDGSLSMIQNSLKTNPSLKFLNPVLEELPSLWSVITDAWPAVSEIPGARNLAILAQLAGREPFESPETPLSVLLTPVTVIRQIIEFCMLRENCGEFRIVDAQGFCVGFLAAVAVSCSQSIDEFQEMASVMIRLAVCIGAAVDLDASANGLTRSMAVRWKSSVENKRLNQALLASATVCKIILTF